MKHIFADCSSYGKFMIIIGLLVAVPLCVIPSFPEETGYMLAFATPALVSILMGFMICLLGKRDENPSREWKTSMQNSSLTVLFAWTWGFVLGAVPFVLGRQLPVLQSFFESISGWTTTGLSVMDVRLTPHIFLFHRSFMQFCGGLGLVLMMIMLVAGRQSMNLFNAEGHPDMLMPNLKKTVQTIFLMYSSYLAVGTTAYRIAGMKWFDSLLHTMCALSTGGFSTKLNSIGEYNNPGIEIITIVLMLIGTTNFAVLLLFSKGKWRQVARVSEFRFMVVLLAIVIPMTGVSLSIGLNIPFAEALRSALFNNVSALTTTGYSTTGYASWPPFATGILILLMLIGGGFGSTAGGMKMSRVYLLLRLALINIRKRISPARKVVAPHYVKAQGQTPINSSLASDVTGFVVSYMFLFMLGSLFMTITANCSLTEAMFEFASAIGTVGLSIGITGPSTNAGTLIIEMIGMILGRLEIFLVLIGLYTGLMKIKNRKGPNER